MNASLKKRNTNNSDLLSLHPGGIELTLHAAHIAGLSSGDDVLDIGCGTAASLNVLRKEFDIIPHGIDISNEVIRLSSGMFPDMDLRCASACDLPYADASFDAVICECVLTLLEDPSGALLEALRVLKQEGVLLISSLAVTEPEVRNTQSAIDVRNYRNNIINADGLLVPSALCSFITANGTELLLSEDRRNDLTDYMIESIMEYGSLEERIRSDTKITGTSVFDCGCRYDPHNITYTLQIFRKTSFCCYTQVQKQ